MRRLLANADTSMAANPGPGSSNRYVSWRGLLADATPGVVFDVLPGAMLALDGNGRVVAGTQGAARLFGRGLEDLCERALQQLLPALSLSELEQGEGEAEGQHRGGELIPLRWEAQPYDATTGLQVLLLQDLRALRGVECELARARHQLARLQREFERFAYVASNDLQEPLRMVASFTDLLARRYRDRLDEQGQEFLFFAHDGARRMRALLNALFEYSRLGAEPLAIQAVDLSQIQHETVRILGLALKDAHASIGATTLPFVSGHRAHLRALFYQLLSNAVRFRDPARPLRIDVAATRTSGSWQISFSDNGLGIPADYRSRVVAMFQRLPRDRRLPGTGMGLALCRKICDLQGGSLSIEDHAGGGTRVVVVWPDRPH